MDIRSLRNKRKVYHISSSEDEHEDKLQLNTKSKNKDKPGSRKKICTSSDSECNNENMRNEVPIKTEPRLKRKIVSSKTKIKSEVQIKKEVIKTETDIQTFADGTPIEYVKPSDIKYLQREEKKALKQKTKSSVKVEPLWEDYEIIEQEYSISSKTARNIVELFKEGNTIPFIARYRKDAVGQMTPDQLRDVKNTYENTLDLKQKIVTAYNKIKDLGKMTDDLEKTVLNAQNYETLEEIYAPFKPVAGEATIKQQIHIALDEPANAVLKGEMVNFADYVGSTKGLDDIQNVQKNLIAVVSKKISTSTVCLEYIQKMKKEARCTLQTKKINKRTTKDVKPKEKLKQNKEASNFTDYFDRSFSTTHLKPHQILAINRAEHLKYINVTLSFNDFSKQFCYEVRKHFKELLHGRKLSSHFETGMIDCYNNIVVPLLKRVKRSELKAYAEKASLDVFNKNLKQMLLAAPTKNKSILGVDPGFAHGCKLGVISQTGIVLATNVVYPHTQSGTKKRDAQEKIFKDMLVDNDCSLIALGNGTACRETETWITDMISRKIFGDIKVSYTIVNESGASIYSCSKEAAREFHSLDPNLISAVSLARRIQDPLSELVKVEPKHLGIGMYQHDVNQKRLEEVLADVVSECVSFVGVDINTASRCLLKHVAGLTERRADEIITHREREGRFKARDELTNVKGIGPLTYKQCAGFLKISTGANKLDATIVHPESYHIAKSVIKHLRLCIGDIGSDAFIARVKSEESALLMDHSKFKTTKENLEVVLEGLSKPLEYDLREDGCAKPLFREGVTNLATLHVGMTLTGAVNNCTSFGSFIDIGVGCNGLLHSKNARGVNLHVGDRVEVKIMNLELERKRIGLELVTKL